MEFVEVMTQWRRMCNKYFDGKNWVCSKTCPMYVFEVCSKPTAKYPVPLEIGQDLAHEIDRVIMAWAEENPEPVYPTWLELAVQQGFKIEEGKQCTDEELLLILLMASVNTPIPSDIAEKLGIEPKEDA